MRRGLATLAVAATVLTGCVGDGLGGVTVVTSGTYDVGPATVLGDVVVLGGSLRLDAGSSVEGSAHLLEGGLAIAGEVRGDITVVGGRLVLEPTALIDGDVSIGASGEVEIAAGARVLGTVTEGATARVDVDSGASDPVSLLLRVLVLAVAIAGVRQLAPRRSALVGGWVGRAPAASIAYGFLLGLVGLSLAVFMAFTIILLPVALILLVAIGLAGLVGLAGVAVAVEIRLPIRGRPRHGLGSIACAVLLNVSPLVPVAGLFLTVVLAMVALGAVGLSLQRGSAPDRPPQGQEVRIG